MNSLCSISVNVAQAGYSSKNSTVIRKIGKLENLYILVFKLKNDVIEIRKQKLTVVVKFGLFS